MAEEQQPAETPQPKPTAQLRICVWCGTPFAAPKKSGPAPRYCKAGCKQRAYEERKRQDEITAIHDRQQKQLDRILGTLGAKTAAKVRKAVETEPEADQAGPDRPQIEGQAELTVVAGELQLQPVPLTD
ncbi:hypothetical protein F4556_007586 [Kitasatospora gansuensis]|uniref:Uncharacterized protein n=3 Tax=Kitasatospora TaxID=2063 RepID=A0A7W7SKC2_9ACTN|nr:hypothetical protein [Kitasatospora gansuensis]MBB4951932.1 hypothetical protein [Kitasatospora gansuensis]